MKNKDYRVSLGNSYYDIIGEHISRLSSTREIDIRQIYYILDHKSVLAYTVKYLIINKFITNTTIHDDCESLYSECKLLLNKTLKCITTDNKSTEGIINQLHSIKKKESDLLDKILEAHIL